MKQSDRINESLFPHSLSADSPPVRLLRSITTGKHILIVGCRAGVSPVTDLGGLCDLLYLLSALIPINEHYSLEAEMAPLSVE